jgi:hypothetical protein
VDVAPNAVLPYDARIVESTSVKGVEQVVRSTGNSRKAFGVALESFAALGCWHMIKLYGVGVERHICDKFCVGRGPSHKEQE